MKKSHQEAIEIEKETQMKIIKKNLRRQSINETDQDHAIENDVRRPVILNQRDDTNVIKHRQTINVVIVVIMHS